MKDHIQYYELWNEANDTNYWNDGTGNPTNLYNMVEPEVSVIRSQVSSAQILTPSVNIAPNNYSTWMADWLSLEDNRTRISDIYNFHVYLLADTPETRWTYVNSLWTRKKNDANWATTPWFNSETNFTINSDGSVTCSYTETDCIGQMVRWQLLHDAQNASDLNWYEWKRTIGNTDYDTAYGYMQSYLTGGSFSAACSYTTNLSGIQTWTCPFTEYNGTVALFVWTPSENGTPYTVPSGYIDYRDLAGNTVTVTPGEIINIGVQPIMLEQ